MLNQCLSGAGSIMILIWPLLFGFDYQYRPSPVASVPVEQKEPEIRAIDYTPHTIAVGSKTDAQRELVDYAYKYSLGDMDFILTVERESGFDIHAHGDKDRGNSYGLCQWYAPLQGDVRKEPWYDDPQAHLAKCYEYYSAAVASGKIANRLYGYRVRHTVKDRFLFSTIGQP